MGLDDEQPEDEVQPGDVDKTDRSNILRGKHRQYFESKHLREQLVAKVREGIGITDILKSHLTDLDGNPKRIQIATYKSWRRRWPQFALEVDAARIANPAEEAVGWTKGFGAFRKAYFGMDSPWFHLELVDILENSAPGSITLVLWPPEHGKTTLLEDFCNYKLAVDPTFLIGYGSERREHGQKVLGRVRNRMEPNGPAVEYVLAFGPFAPQTGAGDTDARRAAQQPWGTEKLNVYKKANHDERDYSMCATGIMGSIQGSRFRLLVLDDMQGTKNYSMTETIMFKLRQDWFTRPGPEDRIVIVGTRVGPDDIYQALMDEVDEVTGKPLLDHIIVHPAINHEGVYLWPERYDPDAYDRMRRRVGPEAWERNYLMKPTPRGTPTFTEEIIAKAADPLWAWENPIPDWVIELAITIDPALGGQNAITVQGWGSERMAILDTDGRYGLTRSEQIISAFENLLTMWQGRPKADGTTCRVTHVVIEEMAFQRGLPNDQRLKDLQERYGFFIIPHQTGHNKNDPVIGVSMMALDMMTGAITFPGATDATTQARVNPLRIELGKWRPNVKGTKLKMDRVMSVWFGWLQWRLRRELLRADRPRVPSGPGLPFRPMARPVMPKPSNLSTLLKKG